MTIKQGRNQRTGIERRVFSYSHYIPERRSREDRREIRVRQRKSDHTWGNFSGFLTEKNAA